MGNKINVDISKLFIPHPMQLFIFGTYKENGDANLGLFSWLNFCWDGELAVMVCLDGEKLTKERIKKTNIFSANIVTKPLFPFEVLLLWKKGVYMHTKKFYVRENDGLLEDDQEILLSGALAYAEQEMNRYIELAIKSLKSMKFIPEEKETILFGLIWYLKLRKF